MTGAPDIVIRRIIFALDSATESPDSLEAAAELAERLHAELVGLFVEDANLLRSAALPFVREINLASGQWQAFEPAAIERDMRARAARARRLIEAVARRRHLAFSFLVARGEVGREIAAAAGETDLIVLEGLTEILRGRVQMGSGARAVARQTARTVMVLRHGVLDARNFLVAYEDTPEADRALVIAARLAAANHATLAALVIAADSPKAEELRDRATKVLERLRIEGTVEILGEPSLIDLCGFARRIQHAVLVVGANGAFAKGAAADKLMDEISCPLVLVR
ncbi:MAG: universal stress protein [Alphaproteobacteria bacterium]